MNIDEIKRFCADEDETRFYLHKPWTRYGFTWASNGHIMVRAPAIAEVTDSPGAPNCMLLWNKTTAPKEWFAVPKTTMPAPIPCECCAGTGKDPDDRRYKCDECGGGKTQEDYRSSIEIGGEHFARRYLALIQGWEIAPNGLEGAWILGGGAEGLLMPMRG